MTQQPDPLVDADRATDCGEMETMKPALYINELTQGGAERLVKDVAIELGSRPGVDPVVVVARREGDLVAELEQSSVPVRSLDVDIKPTSMPAAVRELSVLLSETDIDVVHSHLLFAHVTSRIACSVQSVAHVSTYHNVSHHKPLPKRLFERPTELITDRVVCVSEGVRQSFPWSDRFDVIYNAIDVESFRDTVSEQPEPDLAAEFDPDDTVLLNVARCVSQKRQRDLIDAMDAIDDDSVHLVMVGDGPLKSDLEREVRERNLGECITLTGYVESIEPYYGIADLFVSASSNEGLPTTHVEAMAAQLGVVSTDIPGVREMVDEQSTGYLYPVGEPRELASIVEGMDTEEMHRLGERGFARALETFSLDQITSDHCDLYREVVGVEDG